MNILLSVKMEVRRTYLLVSSPAVESRMQDLLGKVVVRPQQ